MRFVERQGLVRVASNPRTGDPTPPSPGPSSSLRAASSEGPVAEPRERTSWLGPHTGRIGQDVEGSARRGEMDDRSIAQAVGVGSTHRSGRALLAMSWGPVLRSIPFLPGRKDRFLPAHGRLGHLVLYSRSTGTARSLLPIT